MVLPQPDKDGYVTVTWPSKNVPHGGIMHSQKVDPTPERQQFLKVLLEESKLSIVQRQKNGYSLRQPEPKKEPAQKFETPRARPGTSKRRSLSAIRAVNALDDYVYKPLKRGEDRERLKDRLAQAMAFGTGDDTMGCAQITPPPIRPPKKEPTLPTAKEQWHELLSQIRERAEWLAEMEVLGQASPHRDVIQDQIAERIRAMQALGVDSECSSARSGFSTMRSKEPSSRSYGSRKSKQPSVCSTSSQEKGKPKEGSVRSHESSASKKEENVAESLICSPKNLVSRPSKKDKDENVMEYKLFTPLKLSPRRRQ